MGSHDPFGHLKHKLWPKEESGVKLAIWLPTTKSRESPYINHVHDDEPSWHIYVDSLVLNISHGFVELLTTMMDFNK